MGQWLIDQDAAQGGGGKKGLMTENEASAKITAGMKGMHTRKELAKGNTDRFADADRDAKLEAKKAAGVRMYLSRVSANCLGPWLLLKESGIVHSVKDMDLMKGETREPKFININPCHTVPTIKDTDNTVIFESNAIMRYICSQYQEEAGHFWPTDPVQRAKCDMALDLRHTLYEHISAMSYPKLGFGGDDASAAKAKDQLPEVLDVLLNHVLKDGPFVCGSDVTIGDMSIVPLFELAKAAAVDLPDGHQPRIDAYVAAFEGKCPNLSAVRSGDGELGLAKVLLLPQSHCSKPANSCVQWAPVPRSRSKSPLLQHVVGVLCVAVWRADGVEAKGRDDG